MVVLAVYICVPHILQSIFGVIGEPISVASRPCNSRDADDEPHFFTRTTLTHD